MKINKKKNINNPLTRSLQIKRESFKIPIIKKEERKEEKIQIIPFLENEKDQPELTKINDEYQLIESEQLGGGAFGVVYKCISLIDSKKEFAAKVESNDSIKPQLNHEYKILKYLEGEEGIPKTYLLKNIGFSTIMIFELLGPNLEDILKETKAKKFTYKTCGMILKQMNKRLNYIHDCGIIHRDLKPENFIVSTNVREGIIYLIDFGLSKKFMNPKTKEHIPFKTNRPIMGTAKYTSLNTHKGFEQSRRDDLESLAYIIIYFFYGELPWSKIKVKTKEEVFQKVYEIKSNYKDLDEYKNLPNELSDLINYCTNLEYEEKPNYFFIKTLAERMIGRSNNEELFDWQNIEFMIKPIFMIIESKKKKREEKKKLEIEKAQKEREEKERIEKEKERIEKEKEEKKRKLMEEATSPKPKHSKTFKNTFSSFKSPIKKQNKNYYGSPDIIKQVKRNYIHNGK